MEETGCHIHFPDSNKPKPRVAFPCFKPSIADLRNNLTTEKSNQVYRKFITTVNIEDLSRNRGKNQPRKFIEISVLIQYGSASTDLLDH